MKKRIVCLLVAVMVLASCMALAISAGATVVRPMDNTLLQFTNLVDNMPAPAPGSFRARIQMFHIKESSNYQPLNHFQNVLIRINEFWFYHREDWRYWVVILALLALPASWVAHNVIRRRRIRQAMSRLGSPEYVPLEELFR